MELKFTDSFKQDRDYYTGDNDLFRQIAGKIKEIEKADSIKDIPGLEEIRGRKVFFRFKIKTRKTTYRVGIKLLSNIIWFSRLDNDKKRFYKRFK